MKVKREKTGLLIPDDEKITLDEFHYHEFIDRLYMINEMIGCFLEDHILYDRHIKVKKMINEASQNIRNAYEIMINIDFEKFEK